MPSIERWFIENGVCDADFLIWENKDLVGVINHKLEAEFKQKWKALNSEENNWYSAPWNKWVEFVFKGENSHPQTKKYWLYSPGTNASKWEEFYSLGIMGLGWDKLGDINQFASKEEIAARLKEIENSDSSKSNDTIANFDFKKYHSGWRYHHSQKGN
ncbi:hypothetical protein ACFS7Z_24250 [Pontibacter toksunensis]|uniref:Uncharacterized protein n=1 Tax=Pontibacter toksunensis TaxID=1332631 RepID=A0ABW6C2P8_9BACT